MSQAPDRPAQTPDLTAEELDLLVAVMAEPMFNREPKVLGLCLRLCGRKLLQRAGTLSLANGWDGSPHAFVLTREGWAAIKAERRRAPVRRAG